MFTAAVADFPLEHVATVAPQPAVESETVGELGFGGASIPERPSPGVKFMHPAPRVSARIGGIVPGASTVRIYQPKQATVRYPEK